MSVALTLDVHIADYVVIIGRPDAEVAVESVGCLSDRKFGVERLDIAVAVDVQVSLDLLRGPVVEFGYPILQEVGKDVRLRMMALKAASRLLFEMGAISPSLKFGIEHSSSRLVVKADRVR